MIPLHYSMFVYTERYCNYPVFRYYLIWNFKENAYITVKVSVHSI